jgi:hypothetical protein
MLPLEKRRQERMGRVMSSGSKVAFERGGLVMLPLLGDVSARIPDYCLMLPAAPWHPFMYLKSSIPNRFNRHTSSSTHLRV